MNTDLPRVTFVIDDLGHGGAQRQLLHTVRGLAGAVRPSVVVLSDMVEPYGARIRGLGVPVEVIARRGALPTGRALALAETLRGLGADVAHAMLEASDAYAFLAAWRRRIPAVLSLRSDRIYSRGVRARMLGWMFRRAPAVTTNSLAGRECLVQRVGVRPERVHVIPNVVEVPDRTPPPPHPGVIGAVGRLVPLKRVESIIEALPAVRGAVPGARLVVVGDGPARPDLEARARRADVAGAVEFTGAVDDASSRIGTFSCLVVASAFEGLPNTALEALARGVPVVAVGAGDLPRIIQHGVSGVLARDDSPTALSDAIIRALSSPQLRLSAAQEGPKRVREEFSAGRARDRLMEIYAEVLRPGKKSGAPPVGGAPDIGV
jgi:glycosyltransferase involved in cell wall biosynthesis